MQPSSLIFLVIIGIWAAYFVQYWVRRREHLATIRSVDAFSETMRVLQRRAQLPSVDSGSQAPRTYAVSPARAMRPQVTVKRAEAYAVHSQPSVPAVARGAAWSSSEAGTPTPSRPAARPSPPVHDLEPEVATMRPSRATRGIVLLVGLLGTVVFGALAAFGILVPWAPAVPLVMAGAGFAWLRAGVRSEIRARHEARFAARQPVRHASSRSGSTVAAPARSASTTCEHEAAAQASAAESGAETPLEQHEAAEAAQAARVAESPFDVAAPTSARGTADVQPVAEQPSTEQPVAEPAEQPAAVFEVALPEVDEDDIPLTWDPRPVPRPTYTMKAKAPERPAPAAPVEAHDEGERTAYDDVPQRRISGL